MGLLNISANAGRRLFGHNRHAVSDTLMPFWKILELSGVPALGVSTGCTVATGNGLLALWMPIRRFCELEPLTLRACRSFPLPDRLRYAVNGSAGPKNLAVTKL
ncbi:hypothetical protein AB2H60_24920 (plasmid) [Escherichia coli]